MEKGIFADVMEKIDSAPCTVIGGFSDYKCDSPGDTRFILFEAG